MWGFSLESQDVDADFLLTRTALSEMCTETAKLKSMKVLSKVVKYERNVYNRLHELQFLLVQDLQLMMTAFYIFLFLVFDRLMKMTCRD